MTEATRAQRLRIDAPPAADAARILTPEALALLEDVCLRFGPERKRLLAARDARQARINAGELPDFLPETAAIRAGDWKVAPIPADLWDRRVEITGPVERKMIINALNSGAKTFMADFEDSNAPSWANQIGGQGNLFDAVRRQIDFTTPEGKAYRLNPQIATLIVRPRGWHLDEAHVTLDGEPISGSLFDFVLFLFHNGRELLERGSGPYFYLPKLESHLEARLWNLVIDHCETRLQLPRGSVKVTVLIETLLGAFEMDEILYELREHIVGLNCGRWDYIFSYIRTFQTDPSRVLPERAQVTMAKGFLRAYSQLLIKTCHRRGAFAMGGMAAQIPIKNDPAANEAALAKVRADKEREASDGHDGTWVAHPGLVPVAMEIFDKHMPGPNQLTKLREGVVVSQADLINPQEGTISEAGVRLNMKIGLQYIGSWFSGNGCVPIHNLMEDAATAEISRAQLWQWVRTGAALDDGRTIDAAKVEQWLGEELLKLKTGNHPLSAADLDAAADILKQLALAERFERFLTLPAYGLLLQRERG
ncbi:MAG: malate synthase A [Rhodanobacteraceae bacterium]|nr:malate synthase A [Rhodanobacteraceae bacterium]